MSNPKTRLLVGLGFVTVLALGAYAYFGSGGVGSTQSEISQDVVRQFTATTRARVARTVAPESEAYEPYMFLQAYPGLVAADFDGVSASEGVYRYQGGEVVYDPEGRENLNAASRAISDIGMKELLQNIAKRLKFDLGGEDTLDEVLDALDEPAR